MEVIHQKHGIFSNILFQWIRENMLVLQNDVHISILFLKNWAYLKMSIGSGNMFNIRKDHWNLHTMITYIFLKIVLTL